MEIATFSYAKVAVISPEWMWRSAAQFYCFTLKIAPFSTETVGNDIYWVTGENVLLPCFSDASHPVLQFLGWWGLTLSLLKRLAIFTCWRRFFTVWFWPSGCSILIYFFFFFSPGNTSLHESPGNWVLLCCLIQADKIICCFLPTALAFSFKIF